MLKEKEYGMPGAKVNYESMRSIGSCVDAEEEWWGWSNDGPKWAPWGEQLPCRSPGSGLWSKIREPESLVFDKEFGRGNSIVSASDLSGKEKPLVSLRKGFTTEKEAYKNREALLFI